MHRMVSAVRLLEGALGFLALCHHVSDGVVVLAVSPVVVFVVNRLFPECRVGLWSCRCAAFAESSFFVDDNCFDVLISLIFRGSVSVKCGGCCFDFRVRVVFPLCTFRQFCAVRLDMHLAHARGFSWYTSVEGS